MRLLRAGQRSARRLNTTIPVCYYLYSLEGALSGRHWDALGPNIKQRLLSQLSPNKPPRTVIRHRAHGAGRISARLVEIVEALPLREGMRVLEIGCGPGVAARAVLERIGNGHVLAIDRSAKAIALAQANSRAELATRRLEFRHVSVEDLVLENGERPYHLAFAVRVGALDGRHPEAGRVAVERIRKMLMKNGRLFIDGNPLKEVPLGGA